MVAEGYRGPSSCTRGCLNRASDVRYMRGKDKRKTFVHTVMCWGLPLEQDLAGIEIKVRNAL